MLNRSSLSERVWCLQRLESCTNPPYLQDQMVTASYTCSFVPLLHTTTKYPTGSVNKDCSVSLQSEVQVSKRTVAWIGEGFQSLIGEGMALFC